MVGAAGFNNGQVYCRVWLLISSYMSPDLSLLIGVVQVIRYSEGFVKGVCCHGRRFIAAQSNEKRVVVWAKSKPSQAPTLDPSKTVSTPDPLKTVSTPDPSKTVSTPDPLKTISIPDASKTATGGFQVSIDETELFAHGPNDLPYNRRGR